MSIKARRVAVAIDQLLCLVEKKANTEDTMVNDEGKQGQQQPHLDIICVY